jgi:hypothetical protein
MKLRERREERRKKAARRRYERKKGREREPDAQEAIWQRAKGAFMGWIGLGGGP